MFDSNAVMHKDRDSLKECNDSKRKSKTLARRKISEEIFGEFLKQVVKQKKKKTKTNA